MEAHALAIHIWYLQVNPFPQAQSAGVNGGQAGPVVLSVQAAQHPAHFLATENDRELFLFGGTYKVQGGPRAVGGMLVKELDATQSNRAGTARSLLLVFEVEEILAQFFLGDAIRGFVVVFGQLSYSADIRLLRFRGETAQLHVLNHPLSERCHNDTSCL
jgi:hypothetical protein